MAWTSPRTWVAGEVVTAALLNTHVRDNLLDLGPIAETPALLNGCTALADGNNAYRRGRQVTVALHLQVPAGGLAAGSAVASVTTDYRPPRVLYGVMFTNSDVAHPIRVDTNGNIVNAKALGASAVIYGFFTYAV